MAGLCLQDEYLFKMFLQSFYKATHPDGLGLLYLPHLNINSS